MAGGNEPDGYIAEVDGLAVSQRLRLPGGGIAVARPHDGEGLRRGEHPAVAGPGVVGMAVGDDGAADGAHRIDMEIGRRAPQAALRRLQPVFRTQPVHAALFLRFGLVPAPD